MKYVKFFYVGVLMSLAIACSSDDDGGAKLDDDSNSTNEISEEPFSGTINDTPYVSKYAFGELQINNSGAEELKFYLSDIEFDCNSDFSSISYEVRGTVLTDQLGFQITTVTTNTGSGIANQTGEVADLVSINETEAVIKVRTKGTNYVLEGKFTVTICPMNETTETNK